MSKTIERLAAGLAVAGGLLLCALALMIVVSVTGRAFVRVGLGPIPGDFELVEVGAAICVFFFLPWCHLRGGHATVDLFYSRFPLPLQRAVTVVSEWLMLILWLLLTWRLGVGLIEKYRAGETTFILQWPLWWGYALCMAAAVAGCVVYASKAWVVSRAGGAVASTAGAHA
ncbi:MAG: TRAP transporter small permease [Casimicrobiaceae bacterium]|nr:TRAP transporter small permease [Casimicrobiaceae bacterium]MCX8097792.1 TRAP transporter small permease [Casimicrobiaceae bacterium]MDW8312642.1 TRAP transporter small permease [Burkholderiales bacterium]